jgi:dTDP-4-dehydrorhamnose reductase
MSKFILYGHKGWIGQQVINLLDKGEYSYVLGNNRADNIDLIKKELLDNNVTHVISLIGRTHGVIENKEYPTIDYLEQKGKLYENIRDNLYSPIILAMVSKELGIHFTYMGTGCIFEYDNEHPFGKEESGFTEDSLPNFFGSSYSIVKGFTDRLMHLYSDNVLNVRIRMPITNNTNSRNFITKITTYKKVCSVPNSMSVLPELLPIMIDMIDKKVTGTINLCNPGLITHNEILEMYKEYVNPDFTWENFTLEEQSQILAAGRSNNFMETNKLQSLYPQVKDIKESVRDVLKTYKNENFN